MRGYDEYDTAPLDHPDHTLIDTLIDTAGPCPADNPHHVAPCGALQGAVGDPTAGIDLASLPF